MGNISLAVIGGGSIGVSFALLFATKNIAVQIYEPDLNRIKVLRSDLKVSLNELMINHLISSSVDEKVLNNIEVKTKFSDLNSDADYVIECVPEVLETKKEVFSLMEQHFSENAVFISASSALMMSDISKDLIMKCRCLIAHPANPPHLIPIIELVPSSFTSKDIVEKTKNMFLFIGKKPVVVQKEIEGFIFNRLQGAILREAYCLVRDGIATVKDIDMVVSEGLGIRWAVIGPFETIDLNTRGGIESHAKKLGPAYQRMGNLRGQNDPWTSDLVSLVVEQRRKELPLKYWSDRVQWRDKQIIKILKSKI